MNTPDAAPRMMKFRVMQGCHISPPFVYREGAVVESPFDLRKKFPDMFLLVDPKTPSMRELLQKYRTGKAKKLGAV